MCNCGETICQSLLKVSAGVKTLIKCKQWSNGKHVKYLTCQRNNNGEVLVHSKCRKDYTNQRRLDSFLKKEFVNESTTEKVPSSLWNNLARIKFDAIKDKNHPDRNIAHLATTLPFRSKILKLC